MFFLALNDVVFTKNYEDIVVNGSLKIENCVISKPVRFFIFFSSPVEDKEGILKNV